ncbi:ABC transporter ATP-binding protein [Azospirillum picis]|uniref:ATP-binding cassette subfamily B protein n=1 Tax=Azospirillum picis TaxID=488438 RepID=A0ABU0MSA7_9PROT|nr:ABC transporter ATP-binding protein [Azospirillum picis]MBP2302417.1 ATP-binding cassette subfamily B protein [Azospirillum picis]MDQ0535996.1 ATP-binding cassette subfamily B protein [Azospirillum picis]
MSGGPGDPSLWSSDPLPGRPAAFLWGYIRRWPAHFGGLLALVVGAAACAVAVQYGMKLLVDAMAAPDTDRSSVWSPLLLFIVLIGAENALWRSAGWLACRTVVGVGVDIRLDLFRHLTGHPVHYFAEHFSGALGNRITQTAGAVGALTNTITWNILPPCIDFIGAVIVLSTIQWQMAAALALFVLVVAGVIGGVGVRGRPRHRAYSDQAAQAGGELVDVVSNMWAVKAFSARAIEAERLESKFGREAKAQRGSWLYLEKTRMLHDAFLWVMAGGMLSWAVWQWTQGRITPGDVVVVTTLTFRILHGSRDLAFALVGTTQQFGMIAETLRVIGPRHAVADAPDARPLVPLGGAIDFEAVSFAYPDGRRVFRAFSLHVPAGQRVGVVGPSGAGKSTLVGLLQRLDDPQAGRVLIDGQELTAVTQDSLRAAIAVVPQEIVLFHRSVLENIRYGRPDATDEEVMEAAHAARCDDFIRALPEGYGTLVGERGIKLSGGQRQRIGIARAILKDAPIIVLDEATSALDSHSEAEVQQALERLIHGRTVLAVAHRLSTLGGFDRIVVMADGRIVEDGPPSELHARGGAFHALWRMQAHGLGGGPAARQTG